MPRPDQDVALEAARSGGAQEAVSAKNLAEELLAAQARLAELNGPAARNARRRAAKRVQELEQPLL